MTEVLKESLSAFMDDEASELEFQRILSDIDNQTIRQTWRRYHLARSIIREGSIKKEFTSLDISPQVSKVLVKEAFHRPVWNIQQVFRPVASFAIAASVAIVIIISHHWLNDDVVTPDESIAAETTATANTTNPGAAVSVRTVNFDRNKAFSVTTDRSAIYNNFARQRLQRFMQHHAEHASLNSVEGMMIFARVANSDVK